ncbi:GRP family sugar transporter [Lactobacillus gigeriorum]|uniref:Glucose uptake protein n=1 Tax=Lactobacillus gigeriorum DSM 23908 = CRBIP 24.85 TaxID=1423751 RepID=I7K0C8_9LACO|nr:GRP family sugar transporter [Lactobacillus gigeriorum]KRN14038.1 glucose uptake protein [Lactobacillus gigeriorum DSM 23908 = CRBIP 24.85]CCI86800.1 Glucose uptake protein [Lactobacillus gigeriorum DSM 23908 = CRBIP 24.85]
MKYIYMFIPALAWGILPLAVSKIKGKPVNQIFGTTVGTLIVAVLALPMIKTAIDAKTFMLAALAGAFWVIGQLGQYTSYARVGVSETMPISTGLQLIGTSLVGVTMFGEWPTANAKLWGFIGIALLIVGAIFTSFSDKNTSEGSEKNQVGTLIMLVLTTFGYIIYNFIPKAMTASGLAIFFPESLGMVIAVLVYMLASGNAKELTNKSSWQSLLSGFIFAIAAIGYILSVKDNGVNTAFVVSQLSVVISTLGGMLFLHETKSKKGYIFTLVGLALILVGAILTTVMH